LQQAKLGQWDPFKQKREEQIAKQQENESELKQLQQEVNELNREWHGIRDCLERYAEHDPSNKVIDSFKSQLREIVIDIQTKEKLIKTIKQSI